MPPATVTSDPVASQLDGARFESLLLEFLAYLEMERGLSRNTLNAYRTDLLQFGDYLEEKDLDAYLFLKFTADYKLYRYKSGSKKYRARIRRAKIVF